MQIAVASGKGGTGKTTVATSLALSLLRSPAADMPLSSTVTSKRPMPIYTSARSLRNEKRHAILLPQIDPALCTACGRCVEVCQFHALALIGKKVLVFPQLCHGCGSCTLNCPENAITRSAKSNRHAGKPDRRKQGSHLHRVS
jgi:MinD superfamily P-loop ATPase